MYKAFQRAQRAGPVACPRGPSKRNRCEPERLSELTSPELVQQRHPSKEVAAPSRKRGAAPNRIEKLKMLDYEDHFRSFRPLSHTYFAIPSSNPNEQFYYFTSIASWLVP